MGQGTSILERRTHRLWQSDTTLSQHVAGLQIRTPEGEWKFVKPVAGGITCNAADSWLS
jgi:isopenicillin N synthase-like dioxygenase